MSCIGTAGHVDHGKSTLVEALTGIDPDRLAEEKARGMTIDLGFAWLTLPSGREVSIVDVPGHESFIKNMLAGVGGIDAALLVIAADEGVMPQTREHLAILDLLHVQHGIVVLTKADLVDEEWLALVQEEVVECLKATTLANSAIIPVSAYTKQGIPTLLAELDRVLAGAQDRQNIGRPRLPIDRVFSMTGFGTIVTGTLIDGGFKVGQEVEILPQGLRTRVRTLQTHKRQVEQAQPGNRVAMNLAGVSRSELARGNVVTLPNQIHATRLFDARIELLATAPRPLMHNALVDLYIESQELPAKVRLLNVEELRPGQSAWVQLRLTRPAVVTRRDRFILRIPSPSTTIGGGEIVDVSPRYHKRFQPHIVDALERLAQGLPEELVLAALDRRVFRKSVAAVKATPTFAAPPTLQGLLGYELMDIAKHSTLEDAVTLHTLETLLSEGRVIHVGTFWFAQYVWEMLEVAAIRLVREYHHQYPLRGGLSKEEWRSRLNLPPKVANEVFLYLQNTGVLATAVASGGARTGGSLLCLPGYTPRFTVAQQQQVERVLQAFAASPFTPPTRGEVELLADVEVVAALIEQNQLVKIGDGILFSQTIYVQALQVVTAYLQTHPTITVAEARDLLGTTRKYILPFLEHMDALQRTKRVGDVRTLGPVPFHASTKV